MTKNADLPTTENAFDRSYNGEDHYSGDIHIMKFAPLFIGIKDQSHSASCGFQLHQNYPNPFNPATTIRFTLQKSEHVSLKIYNLAGQKIETLVNGVRSAGDHQVQWQAEGFSSGIYLARLQANPSTGSGYGIAKTMKLVLQK
jgi:hypothetical protein